MSLAKSNKSEKAPVRENTQEDSDDESVIMLNGVSFTRNEVLVCAKYGKIYCVHKKDGSRLWSNRLPSKRFISSVFMTDLDTVLVSVDGLTVCYSLHTGEQKWVHGAKGSEAGAVICTPSRFLSPKVDMHDSDHAHQPPSYDTTEERSLTISSTHGKVMAIDATTGETLWKYDCPGGGYRMPVTLVEPPSAENGLPYRAVYVGCGQWVYCLKALTGDLIWSQRISNYKIGMGYIVLATLWSSRMAAETHISFSQFPIAQLRNEERIREKVIAVVAAS
ncbi:hypothetical protein EC973_005255 [Apophysomyces ossiformis]|uniref:Pyrrolo-quinoline quinone repeat domain-containing protein n=1 Tax=Apophysomyces ossiformis TaxID=679940 RepID=A0A8H7C0U4_9FUNG|nr:hypothetical protein EC973_005255 [Apophysomyces ossiformis]